MVSWQSPPFIYDTGPVIDALPRCRVAAPCWFSMPCCGSAGGHIPGCCCSSFGHGKGVGRKLAAPALEATAKYLRARCVGICGFKGLKG